MNPLFRIDFSISDSLKIVRKSVLIYETIIHRKEPYFETKCPEAAGSVPTPEHAAGMGQETFSGRTATESKMEGTHER